VKFAQTLLEQSARLAPGFRGDLVSGRSFDVEKERLFDDTAKALEQAIRTEG
jgi:hypothetical protein